MEQKSSLEVSWKTKGNIPTGQFWSPADFSLFHYWIMPSFGYVVRLAVEFILNGGDRKLTLRNGFVHVEQ